MQQLSVLSSRPRMILIGIGAALIAVSLAACAPKTKTQGNLVDPQLLGQIKPGALNKDEVQNLIGTPSSVATFDPNTWYYISKQTRRYAFLNPEILEQQVIVIEFDDKGVVRTIRKLGEQDGKDVQIVERTTPTRGKSLGMFDQLWATLINQLGTGNGIDASKRDPFNRGR